MSWLRSAIALTRRTWSASVAHAGRRGLHLLDDAARSESEGRLGDAIELLVAANRARTDAAVERRLIRLRREAFSRLERRPPPVQVAGPVAPGCADELRPLPARELDATRLRSGILTDGAVWVRGLIPRDLVRRMRDAIDRAFEAYDAVEAGGATPDGAAWYDPQEGWKDPFFGRRWRRQANALFAVDSPRAFFTFLELVRAVRVDRLLRDFFGEQPSLAAEKCTLFRVDAKDWRMRVADWHQDGAFLGDGIRTVNCWFALSRCGRDAPGIDIVPRRITRVLPVGEEGCHFDWTLSPKTVVREVPGAPVFRPQFEEGDALLFDELAIHRTAADEGMPNTRYAIESWFFASSSYPVDRSTPLVV